MPGLGVTASWRTGDWELELDSFGSSFTGSGTQLTILREDTDPPLSADGSGCAITITKQNAQGLAGTATCKGLRWAAAIAPFSSPDDPPSPAAGHPPFDATITFSATP